MAVYIDIDALIDAQLYDDEHEEWNWQRMSVRDYLSLACDVLPTAADVRPVVRGRWERVHKYDVDSNVRCSNCLTEFDYIDGVCYLCKTELPPYCPNCGADMRGDTDGDKA